MLCASTNVCVSPSCFVSNILSKQVKNFITRKSGGGSSGEGKGGAADDEAAKAGMEATVNDGPKQSLELTDQVFRSRK